MRRTSALDRRPVVVGVDDSAASRAALRVAFEEGLARDVPVQVVTTWTLGLPHRDTLSDRAYDEESIQARRVQDAVVADVLDSLDRVPEFSQAVFNDLSGPALTDAARNASVLVVGTNRRNALSRAFLGSVSEFCVRHSPVPVIVVPEPGPRDEGNTESGVLAGVGG